MSGSANQPLAASVAHGLAVPLCPRILERFADGELHVTIDASVRGHDVYIVQSTNVPGDAHLMELLFLADACRRAGAARVTAVIPYFGYARQDRRASGRDAVGAAVVASLIEAAGVDRVVSVDLHAPEIEGFFRIPVEQLSAIPLLAGVIDPPSEAVIVAPDLGAVKLAERYQAFLHRPVVLAHKTRVSGSAVSLRSIIGHVANLAPIVVDDMITTGGTIDAAVRGLLEAGCAPHVTVVATHMPLAGPARERLGALPIRHLVGTNSVDTGGLPANAQVVDLAPLLAEAIHRLHRDRPLGSLLTHV
jgi:ribose-phosphate pyrophosphokinase